MFHQDIQTPRSGLNYNFRAENTSTSEVDVFSLLLLGELQKHERSILPVFLLVQFALFLSYSHDGIFFLFFSKMSQGNFNPYLLRKLEVTYVQNQSRKSNIIWCDIGSLTISSFAHWTNYCTLCQFWNQWHIRCATVDRLTTATTRSKKGLYCVRGVLIPDETLLIPGENQRKISC